MAKDKSAPETTPDVSFEEALQALQEIVESLESGSLGLEESLARFEQGIGLLKTCNDVLEQAEQRIETLTGFDADGEKGYLTLAEKYGATQTLRKPLYKDNVLHAVETALAI